MKQVFGNLPATDQRVIERTVQKVKGCALNWYVQTIFWSLGGLQQQLDLFMAIDQASQALDVVPPWNSNVPHVSDHHMKKSLNKG